MLSKLRDMNARYEMFSTGDSIVCAVSGGADSMALLWAMYLMQDTMPLKLSAAHFNHGLRGQESDSDEAFVRDFCSRYGIPLAVGRGSVVSGEKGLEAAARDARYQFLESLPGKIATAHTADDNAETMLMHLIRGTGLKGLGGISPVRGRLIRPMLTVTRQEILEFLEEYHIPWIEDSSNDSDAFLRNRVRHHLMPFFREENPKIAENLSETALRLRQDEDALTELSQISGPVSVENLQKMQPALRARALAVFLRDAGVREPEAEHIRMAERLLSADNPSARSDFPGGVTISRNYSTLEARKAETPLEPIRLQVPGVTEIPGLNLRITCREADRPVLETDRFTVSVSGDIWVRCRKAGDRIRLHGGSKDLKKLFIDRKIPADSRLRIPVLQDSLGILGVWGIGANLDRAADSLPAMEIRFEKIQSACAEII